MTRRMCGMCLLLLLLLAVATVVGQGGGIAGQAPEAKGGGTPPSAPQPPEGAPDLRRVQVRMLREGALSRVVAGIKEINEPALRISARNELLMHLVGDRKADEESGPLTAQMASDALADFGEHAEEIPPFMADYLFNALGAWRQTLLAHAEGAGYFKTKTALPIAFFDAAALARYKLTATPTTLLIDDAGKVEQSWVGKWGEEKAGEVAAALK